MAAAPGTFSALGRALVQQGRLAQSDAAAIQMEAARTGATFVQQLVVSKKLSAREVSLFAAHAFGYPLVDLAAVDMDQLPLNLIDSKIVAHTARSRWASGATACSWECPIPRTSR